MTISHLQDKKNGEENKKIRKKAQAKRAQTINNNKRARLSKRVGFFISGDGLKNGDFKF